MSANVKVGTKLILMDTATYGSEVYSITTDVIVKENKKSWTTENGQLLSKNEYSNYIWFYYNNSSDRKLLKCDVTEKNFRPRAVKLYDEAFYNEACKNIVDRIEKQRLMAIEDKRNEDALVKYNVAKSALYQKQRIEFQAMHIETKCKCCKFWNDEEKTCNHKSNKWFGPLSDENIKDLDFNCGSKFLAKQGL